jgi:hypothetical protein
MYLLLYINKYSPTIHVYNVLWSYIPVFTNHTFGEAIPVHDKQLSFTIQLVAGISWIHLPVVRVEPASVEFFPACNFARD